MSKIRVLSDTVANQIAAGEVVERPASVAKELVENSIDAGARRIEIDVEAGGRRLLRITDDGEGMTRDDAVLAFERHATSKIHSTEDLTRINTLGFRGEALASIASVARVELVTKTDAEPHGTRVVIEGGRMRDVQPAARPRGTTVTARDLFFNVPARRKFLRSEATESFHLTNLVTHYALAHPEIAFVLTNQGREAIRVSVANDLHERAYQIFGKDFLESMLEISGGHAEVAVVRGYVSAPRERRTSRDAQYLFVNGRYVRDRLISRALSEGYRAVLPHGVYPVALLFLEVPLEEVDVNVHPSKTEVRFRRSVAVVEAVRDAVRRALASAGYLRSAGSFSEADSDAANSRTNGAPDPSAFYDHTVATDLRRYAVDAEELDAASMSPFDKSGGREATDRNIDRGQSPLQSTIEFRLAPQEDEVLRRESNGVDATASTVSTPAREALPSNIEGVLSTEDHRSASVNTSSDTVLPQLPNQGSSFADISSREDSLNQVNGPIQQVKQLPPFDSAVKLTREAAIESLSTNIRPLGQLADSFIVAVDGEGLLLIDQHVAHERILFDKYRKLESERVAESQNLLLPETFDLTPAQVVAFDMVVTELETYGFGLMRLSGRTVAIRAVPADLPQSEARNMLAEVLDTIEAERKGAARAALHDRIAASLACRAAIKINTPLTPEKMQWLIDRLLTTTSSPTTCPHGRPVVLRLSTRDIEKGFHRT